MKKMARSTQRDGMLCIAAFQVTNVMNTIEVTMIKSNFSFVFENGTYEVKYMALGGYLNWRLSEPQMRSAMTAYDAGDMLMFLQIIESASKGLKNPKK